MIVLRATLSVLLPPAPVILLESFSSIVGIVASAACTHTASRELSVLKPSLVSLNSIHIENLLEDICLRNGGYLVFVHILYINGGVTRLIVLAIQVGERVLRVLEQLHDLIANGTYSLLVSSRGFVETCLEDIIKSHSQVSECIVAQSHLRTTRESLIKTIFKAKPISNMLGGEGHKDIHR